jgi:hypothetical protein
MIKTLWITSFTCKIPSGRKDDQRRDERGLVWKVDWRKQRESYKERIVFTAALLAWQFDSITLPSFYNCTLVIPLTSSFCCCLSLLLSQFFFNVTNILKIICKNLKIRILFSMWSQIWALWLLIWWPLEAYMVVNFRARGISRGTRKLARTPTLN